MAWLANRPEGGFREMLLLDIIRDYRPVYPEDATWEETAAMLYAEQPEHMATLKASLERSGWRDPIRLSSEEDIASDEGVAFVLDGTHRVSLAMREGVISLPVVTSDEFPELNRMPTTLTDLAIEQISGEPLTDDEDFEVFDLFISLELNGDIWLNSDIGSGHRGSWSFYYDELQDGVHHGLLERIALKRLRDHFPGRDFKVTASLFVDEDEEDLESS